VSAQEAGNRQRLQSRGLGHSDPEQARRQRLADAAHLGFSSLVGPAVLLAVIFE